MIITDPYKLAEECQDTNLIEANDIILKLEQELSNSKIQGIGLASNQIGINKKVCIIRTKNKINFANPVITHKYDLMEFNHEGCLSFPNQYILTKRFNEIVVKDLFHISGIILTGIDAVVAEHEISHLYGETMFDYEIKKPAGPNSQCWCFSGKKYKKCHYGKVIKIEE